MNFQILDNICPRSWTLGFLLLHISKIYEVSYALLQGSEIPTDTSQPMTFASNYSTANTRPGILSSQPPASEPCFATYLGISSLEIPSNLQKCLLRNASSPREDPWQFPDWSRRKESATSETQPNGVGTNPICAMPFCTKIFDTCASGCWQTPSLFSEYRGLPVSPSPYLNKDLNSLRVRRLTWSQTWYQSESRRMRLDYVAWIRGVWRHGKRQIFLI